MKIETRNVPVLGSSKSLSSSSLSYNIKDIVSLILDKSDNVNPYKAAYERSYNAHLFDPKTLEFLLDTCKKYSNDKSLNEGYYALIGSYLAGFLMTEETSSNPQDNVVFGSLLPFIGVYVELVTRMNREDLLNTDKVCRMLKTLCENHSVCVSSISDSFDISEKEIQESNILPNILKAVLKNIYWNQHIPSENSHEPNNREIAEGASSEMRNYLSKKGYDSEYIDNQVYYITDTILYCVLEDSVRDDPTMEYHRGIESNIRSEINDYIFDSKTDTLERWTSKNMVSATQGFLISTILQYGSFHFTRVGNKMIPIKDEPDLYVQLQKSIPAFMKTMQNYFRMEWYPDFVATTNQENKNRKIRNVFNGIYKEYLNELINIYLNLQIPYDSYDMDVANKEWVRAFSNEVFPKWNLYSKSLEDKDFETPDDSDYYFKYIMGFIDSPMDDLENSMIDNPEIWDRGFDYEAIKPLNESTPSPEKKKETGRMDVDPKTMKMVVNAATEASGSVRYQEKQGSRIGTSVGKAYDKARSGAGEILTQFKKISSAVYKWITTDGNNDKLVLDGRKFTFVGLIKRIIISIGLFHVNIIAGVCAFIFLWSKQKKANKASKRKMIMMLEEEIQMVDEKIQDASSEGNKKAKYALMRSKNQLQNALKKLKYGMGVDLKDEEQPAVREVRDRAMSGGKIAPNDSLRTMNATRNTR